MQQRATSTPSPHATADALVARAQRIARGAVHPQEWISPELAAAVLAVCAAGIAFGWWVAAGPLGTAGRLARLIALAGNVLLVWVLGGALLAATAIFVQSRLPRMSSRTGLLLAALPWLPLLACIPVVVSQVRSGNAAHVLLHEEGAATSFALYLLVWWLILAAAVVVGAALAARASAHSPPAAAATSDAAKIRLSAPWLAVVAAVALTVLFNWGIIDQFTLRQGEFLTHRRAAARVLSGDPLPYDTGRPIWHQINVPPSTFVLFWGPWLLVPLNVGRVLHYIAHYAAFLIAAVLLLRRHIPGLRYAEIVLILVLVASLYAPWREAIWLGQPNGFILLLVVLALRWYLGGRPWWAGAAVTAALTLKPTTTWLLVYFLVARRFRVLGGVAAAGIVSVVVTVLVVGLEPWRVWLLEKVPLLLPGAPLYTSVGLPSLHARLFLTSHAYYAPTSLPPLPLAQALNLTAMGGGLWLLVRLVRHDRPRHDGLGRTLEFGLALALSLALSPLTWLHYATTALVGLTVLLHPGVRAALPPVARTPLLLLGALAWAAFSIDTELLRERTEAWWPAVPLVGSLNNLGPPLLVATLALALWLYNRHQREQSAAADLAGG